MLILEYFQHGTEHEICLIYYEDGVSEMSFFNSCANEVTVRKIDDPLFAIYYLNVTGLSRV